VNQAANLTGDGLFAHDSAVSTRAGRSQIKALAAGLIGDQRVTCEGYTDYAGGSAHDRTLSLHRAQAVCAALRSFGANVSVRSLGYGGAHPVKIGGSSGKRAANRRVVVLVTG
jgi:OOP family OmpA-OmpF porin